MPKARQTCTRCSMRRQKCDRKDPCTRCVQSNEASSCSRKWPHGYDPKIHRSYPKNGAVQHRLQPSPPESDVAGEGPQDCTRPTSLAQNAATMQNAAVLEPPSSLQSTSQIQNLNTQNPLGWTVTNSKGQEASGHLRPSRAGSDPTSLELLLNEILEPYKVQPHAFQSSRSTDVSCVNDHKSHPEPSRAEICPRMVEVHYLQTLLPTVEQIIHLTDYHNTCLLWYHRCVHDLTFRSELLEALEGPNGLQLKHLDLRWCAILFAVMSASVTCASDNIVHTWGFSKAEKGTLSRKWHEATISCLYLADYTSNLHVYSIQAIQVVSMSTHILGFSNQQFVYLGGAIRIAQSLGLQRLAYDVALDSTPVNAAPISQDRKDRLIKREMGRRIWSQLCVQDWFSTPASDMYSINKSHFTTIKPNRFDDETMGSVNDDVAVWTDFGNYFHDIAAVAADFHDAVTGSVTLTAKYEQVLKYDSIMRAVGTEAMPRSLTFTDDSENSKPQWVRWARGTANIVHAHKLIMIHRNFLGKSFTDPRFAYTRWASIVASKTILQEVEIASADEARPMLWTDQAFMVAAGITICLDMLHRTESEPEFVEYQHLVEKAIRLLRSYDDSTLALRGVRLLSSLSTEAMRKQKPWKYRADCHKNSRPDEYEGDTPTWPENRHRIEALLGVIGPDSAADGPLSTASTAISERADDYANTVGYGTQVGGGGMDDRALRSANDFDPINANGSLIKPSDNVLDVSWANLFSECFPAQSGFENAFLIEDLFT